MRFLINEQILFDFYIQRAKDIRQWLMDETKLEWERWFREAKS